MIEKSFVFDALYDQITYNLNNNNGLLIKEDLRILKVFTKSPKLLDLINNALADITSTLLTENAIEDVDQITHYLA